MSQPVTKPVSSAYTISCHWPSAATSQTTVPSASRASMSPRPRSSSCTGASSSAMQNRPWISVSRSRPGSSAGGRPANASAIDSDTGASTIANGTTTSVNLVSGIRASPPCLF
jgi:hypothetical protein